MTDHDPLSISAEIAEAARSQRTESEARATRAHRQEIELRRLRAIGQAERVSDSVLSDGERSLRSAYCAVDAIAAVAQLFGYPDK